MPTNEQFLRAAQFRAKAIAYCNTITDWTPSSDVIESIFKEDTVLGTDVNEHDAGRMLRDLASVGLIAGKKRNGRHMSYRGKGVSVPLEDLTGVKWKQHALQRVKPESKPAPKPAPVRKETDATGTDFFNIDIQETSGKPNNMSIDFVQETGRVRIGVGGFTMEIGFPRR